MVSGTEILVGLRNDPEFGPLLVVGLGGIFVEVLKDISLRLLPVDEIDVRAMLDELKGAAILDAFRGQSARDSDALVKAIVALTTFFLENREKLVEIEINPLVVLDEGNGVRAVDVRPVWKE